MREIIFRGKTLDKGEWVYGNLITDDNDVYILTQENLSRGIDIGGWIDGVQSCEVIPETVGQYTGLKDKNDKKIFEHDIVRIAVGGIYDNHVVSYDKENARFVVGDIDFTMVRIFSPKIEIIGDIHDNPELLEGE